jgi:hypothetical protein
MEGLLRKTPRLFTRRLKGIIVQTEWRSSSATGDGVGKDLMGNRRNGDDPVFFRENLLDLSCNVYSLNDHFHIVLGESANK